MEREKLEGMLIDFIDGRLSDRERKEVKLLLESDSDARVLYEQLKHLTSAMDRAPEMKPSGSLYEGFHEMLNQEISREGDKKGKQVMLTPTVWRAAATVVLVVGAALLGYYVNQYQVQKDRLAKIEEENLQLKKNMLTQIENPNSASQRMQGVNVALNIAQPDDEVVGALVRVMNEDKNTNVRLAALEALTHFQSNAKVKKVLVSSLSQQDDPVVQIALIQLLVKLKEKGILDDLNRIIEDNNTIQPVKDEAYTGIMKLS